MSYSDRSEHRVPTQPVTPSRAARQVDRPAEDGFAAAERTPLSARAAAAQFGLAALLETPSEALRERSLVPPSQRQSSELATTRASKVETLGDGREEGRLPSTWYKQADEIAEAVRRERAALLIRGAAGACLITGTALLFWLGAFGGKSTSPEQSASVTSFAPVRAAISLPAPRNGIEAILPAPIDRGARALVTTAQILAVAERFVATGDVLAARAILSDTAASGDGRALFALAETYDPNLLASWNAQNAEPSIRYARLLYEAALKNGITEAQTRLDALR